MAAKEKNNSKEVKKDQNSKVKEQSAINDKKKKADSIAKTTSKNKKKSNTKKNTNKKEDTNIENVTKTKKKNTAKKATTDATTPKKDVTAAKKPKKVAEKKEAISKSKPIAKEKVTETLVPSVETTKLDEPIIESSDSALKNDETVSKEQESLLETNVETVKSSKDEDVKSIDKSIEHSEIMSDEQNLEELITDKPTPSSKDTNKIDSSPNLFTNSRKKISLALIIFNISLFFDETWLKISSLLIQIRFSCKNFFSKLSSSIKQLLKEKTNNSKKKKENIKNEKIEKPIPEKEFDKEDLEKTLVLKKISDFNYSDIPLPTKKPSKIKIFFSGFIIFIICIGLIVAGFGIGIITKITSNGPKLNLSDFIGQESSKIYDGDGEVIAELGAYLRENVTYDDLPECVVDAFVAIEDSRYFEHNGFDLPRFTKAFLENLKTMSFSQGGSTFTMQLIKNTYFSIDDIHNSTLAQKSIDRKVQEIDLALRIENEMNKEEIFEKYLNKLNFGGNIRGVQKAALYYFGKNVNEISLSEAALLAGIINRPNDYNPYNYLENATQRRDIVLNMMSYHGYISQDEADLAKSIKVEDLLVGEQRTYNRTENQYQSYIDAVVQEVQQLTGKDPALASMKIYTYMNTDVQNAIDSIQDGTIPIPFPDELMQVAMISMNNQTGAILGIGGGRNYDGARLLNRATSNFKQPGSAVKPFLSYALAFEHLYWSSNHVLTDRPMTYKGSSLVLKNFDRKYRGDILLNQAVGQSLNIPAIDTLQQVIDEIGKEKIVEYMQTIGFTKVTNENFDISYAIGGSTYETTVLEMAGAHAMLINKGIYNKPHTIAKIVMQDGTVIYPDKQNVNVLSPGSAYLSAELMRYAVEGPYYNYMQILKNKDYPVYAKTGTTDWGKDGLRFGIPQGAAKDKWMISSTTQFTNAVWLGYDKGVKDKATYFSGYKSGLNIPGKISKILLDTVQATTSTIPDPIPMPNDLEEITYVLGSWPYAYPESWMGGNMLTTALIRKGHPPLTSIQKSIPKDVSNTLSSLTVNMLEDGSLAVTWGISGRCAGGVKDLTLNDGKNYIPASGACIFDPSFALGYPNFFGTVYVDEVPLYNITGTNGYYQGWPGDLYGTVKVCGGFSTDTETSNTMCSYITY